MLPIMLSNVFLLRHFIPNCQILRIPCFNCHLRFTNWILSLPYCGNDHRALFSVLLWVGFQDSALSNGYRWWLNTFECCWHYAMYFGVWVSWGESAESQPSIAVRSCLDCKCLKRYCCEAVTDWRNISDKWERQTRPCPMAISLCPPEGPLSQLCSACLVLFWFQRRLSMAMHWAIEMKRAVVWAVEGMTDDAVVWSLCGDLAGRGQAWRGLEVSSAVRSLPQQLLSASIWGMSTSDPLTRLHTDTHTQTDTHSHTLPLSLSLEIRSPQASPICQWNLKMWLYLYLSN